MNKNLFIYIFVMFLLINLGYAKTTNPSSGSIDSHNNDFLMVLGLSKYKEEKIKASIEYRIADAADPQYKKNRDILGNSGSTLFGVFAAIIDNDSLRAKLDLTEKYNFKFGKDGHRILYHWGYKEIPREREQYLVKKISDPSQAKAFLHSIREYQYMQTRELENATEKYLGVVNQDSKEALTAILYYVHILGDYIEHSEFTDSTIDALVGLDHIIDQLIFYCGKLASKNSNVGGNTFFQKIADGIGGVFQNSDDNLAKMRSEMIQFRVSSSKGNSSSDLSKNANQVLKIFIVYLPSLIKNNKEIMSAYKTKGLVFVR